MAKALYGFLPSNGEADLLLVADVARLRARVAELEAQISELEEQLLDAALDEHLTDVGLNRIDLKNVNA